MIFTINEGLHRTPSFQLKITRRGLFFLLSTVIGSPLRSKRVLELIELIDYDLVFDNTPRLQIKINPINNLILSLAFNNVGKKKLKFFIIKIELRNWNFLVSRNFFAWILILKMSVKMNLRIIMKNHEADPEIGFLTKSISTPYGRQRGSNLLSIFPIIHSF